MPKRMFSLHTRVCVVDKLDRIFILWKPISCQESFITFQDYQVARSLATHPFGSVASRCFPLVLEILSCCLLHSICAPQQSFPSLSEHFINVAQLFSLVILWLKCMCALIGTCLIAQNYLLVHVLLLSQKILFFIVVIWKRKAIPLIIESSLVLRFILAL